MTTQDTTQLTVEEQVERANASGRAPVVFVHGLWLLRSSWVAGGGYVFTCFSPSHVSVHKHPAHDRPTPKPTIIVRAPGFKRSWPRSS